MATRELPTEAVISTISGKLICDISQVYEVCEFMTGHPVWTHQLPDIGRAVREVLLKRQPELKAILLEAELINRTNWQEHRDRFIAKLGPTMTIEPMEGVSHEQAD